MAVFSITANSTDMGEYRCENSVEALDAYAREAGYTDYAELASQFGDDAIAQPIDTDALCTAVEAATGKTVFQDSYGDGIALVDGESFGTYQELAESIGKNCWDFKL